MFLSSINMLALKPVKTLYTYFMFMSTQFLSITKDFSMRYYNTALLNGYN